MAKAKNKNRIPFIIVVVLLGLAILIPVVLLVISSILANNATKKLNESMYPLEYEGYVEDAAEMYGVDICLVYGVIRTESNFDPDAVSGAGAIGLMQIMPETFTWLQNYRTDFMPEEILKSDELYDPETNIDYGVYLLSYLLEKYEGDTSLAICAYNAGYGNVDEWLANGTISEENVTAEEIPFPETSNYLTKVTNAMEMYRELYFSDTDTDTESEIYSDTDCISSEYTESSSELFTESTYYNADDYAVEESYAYDNYTYDDGYDDTYYDDSYYGDSYYDDGYGDYTY